MFAPVPDGPRGDDGWSVRAVRWLCVVAALVGVAVGGAVGWLVAAS